MITLYHAPQSRSSTIVTLIDELGADVEIREVTIPRRDGSGGRDPANPHPEGKVPLLVDGAETIHEQGAIILYLTDRFPEAGLGPGPGAPGRGAYLSWLFYYQGVIEPVAHFHLMDISSPALQATFRDFDAVLARLAAALQGQPYLLGERYSAADLLCSGLFQVLPQFLPDDGAIRDWVARCAARPSLARTRMRDGAAG